MHLGAALLDFADALELSFYPTWLRVSEGFLALDALFATGAFVVAGAGFLRASSRRLLLGAAGFFFAASAAAALVDHVIRSIEYARHAIVGTVAAAEIVGSAASVALVGAGAVTALAFRSTGDRQGRDRALGWASVALVAYFGLTFVNLLLYSIAYSDVHAPAGFASGLAVQSAGSAVGAAGAALAGIAFLRPGPDGERLRVAARDGLLVGAAVIVGLGYLVTAIGALIYAGSLSSVETGGKQVAANWLTGVGYLGLTAAAICAGVAFMISRRTSEQRDGSDSGALADPG